MKKIMPFTNREITSIISRYTTPFHIYDEQGIRTSARKLNVAFQWNKKFRNYFAIKALPNPAVLEILREEGMGVDCSSLAELILAHRAGFRKDEIMFTSNNTSKEEFRQAHLLGAYINIDDISHLELLDELHIVPKTLFFRYTPKKAFHGNEIIGTPRQAKFGMSAVQIINAIKIMSKRGTKNFGLHAMMASNELDELHFAHVARMLFALANNVQQKTGIQISMINLGGGIGIPYSPNEKDVDVKKIGRLIREEYNSQFGANAQIPIFMECGRYITGPHGYLITQVRNVSKKHKHFVGVDANMSDLMRPAIYGSYHHISVLGKEKERAKANMKYDVTGSLCENNDKFAVDRTLPKVTRGDIIVIHDTGAHGHSMGFNYNGKLRSAEILMQVNRRASLIRRAETLDDYFATLSFKRRNNIKL